jgi:drug/metabolite transporter (DMT)-like permease
VTVTALGLLSLSLVAFVTGQLLLKVGMKAADRGRESLPRALAVIGAGIVALAIYFFLTMGLLQQYDLSYLFPFQGVTIIIIMFAAAWLLKEKLTLRLTIGALLITAGVILVSSS